MRKGFDHPPGLSIEVSLHPFTFSITVRALFFNILFGLACEQALLDALKEGREKEGELATTSLELNICIGKVDARC